MRVLTQSHLPHGQPDEFRFSAAGLLQGAPELRLVAPPQLGQPCLLEGNPYGKLQRLQQYRTGVVLEVLA